MEMFLSNVDATRKLTEPQTPLLVPDHVQQLQFVSDLIVFHCNLSYSLWMAYMSVPFLETDRGLVLL